MKKFYDHLFKVSFITYIIYLFREDIGENRDNYMLFISIIAIGLLYQFSYVVFLRKHSCVKLGRAIARYFLYALNTLTLTTLIEGVYLYFFGYDVYSWILPEYIKTVYGMEALRESWYFIVTPLWIVNVLYAVIYYLVLHKLKENQNK